MDRRPDTRPQAVPLLSLPNACWLDGSMWFPSHRSILGWISSSLAVSRNPPPPVGVSSYIPPSLPEVSLLSHEVKRSWLRQTVGIDFVLRQILYLRIFTPLLGFRFIHSPPRWSRLRNSATFCPESSSKSGKGHSCSVWREPDSGATYHEHCFCNLDQVTWSQTHGALSLDFRNLVVLR